MMKLLMKVLSVKYCALISFAIIFCYCFFQKRYSDNDKITFFIKSNHFDSIDKIRISSNQRTILSANIFGSRIDDETNIISFDRKYLDDIVIISLGKIEYNLSLEKHDSIFIKINFCEPKYDYFNPFLLEKLPNTVNDFIGYSDSLYNNNIVEKKYVNKCDMPIYLTINTR